MAAKPKPWTIEEMYRLPDDGNKYEVVWGELFVTPPPTDEHETIAARLTTILSPYVIAKGLGLVYRPRAVMQFEGSEVEPDLMVRQPQAASDATWAQAPTPILIVEILSDSTRRRDRSQKRSFYLDAGVDEYWIVDPETRTITSIRGDRPDVVATDSLVWSPIGADESLEITVANLFS
ncbi:MAG TPA: Uma2 family endonuclease [Vicinamibacterales bacterium]